jgi:hypothetical protein
MDYYAILIVAAATVIYILTSAASLKLWAWLSARFIVPAGPRAPGFFKCCGIVILLNATAAAIGYATFLVFDFFMRQPGDRSSNAMTVGGIIYYPLIFIATTIILKKLLPTSYVAAILINIAQIFVSFMILAFYLMLSIMIAYDFWQKN